MTINYKDTRQENREKRGPSIWFVALAIGIAVLWFRPEIVHDLQGALSGYIRLPPPF
jgi:hypothetical protein